MAVSIYDVAKRAGVSISTVSRILNNSAAVNEKKAAAVREAMEYFHYEPNQFARGLVKQTSHMIGVYFPYGGSSVFDSIYNLELLKGMEMVLSKNNYSLVLIIENEDYEKRSSTKAKFQEYIAQKRIDGLLLSGLTPKSVAEEAFLQMLDEQYPMVYIGKRQHENGYNVYAQYDEYVFQMLKTLYDNGHRQIMLYYLAAHKSNIERVKERAKEQLPDALVYDISYPDYGNILRLQLVIAVKKYVTDRGCTAICSPGTEFTYTLLSVCGELKFSVPEDVSILTAEHRSGEGDLIYPPISAFYVPAKSMGVGAAQMLLNIIREEKTEEKTKEYETSFIERESIKKLDE